MQAALRVPLAVTWLTVYRQLHIMRAGAEHPHGADHSPLASGFSCPEGGNRGGHRDMHLEYGFPHFYESENPQTEDVSVVPDTSRCVDFESATDS